MRVVWVTTAVPHPEGAGADAHEFELIRALNDRHEIHVVSCHADAPLGREPLLAAGARFTEVRYRTAPWPSNRVAFVAGLLRADPTLGIWLARDRIARLAETVAAVVADEGADVVQLTRGELAQLLEHAELPTGVFLLDALARAAATQAAVEASPARRARLRLEARRLERFERRWYPRARGLASVSAVDAAFLDARLRRAVTVIENPISASFFDEPDRPRSDHVVTFVGALNHGPNVDAVTWLIDDIWPEVRRRRPDAALVVVGRGSGADTVDRLRRHVEAVGGRLHADVPDIRPNYWEAAVVTAPLRHGSGLRNKVLHAMACGAPVVATSAALEGVPAAAAATALQADDAAGVASAIVDVLGDLAAARARARAAVSAVQPLGTEIVAARHERWWSSLLD